MNNKIAGFAPLLSLSLLACQREVAPPDSTEQGLSTLVDDDDDDGPDTGKAHPNASDHDATELSIGWRLGEGQLVTQEATKPLSLHLRSDSKRPLKARVTIRLQGLGVERDISMAPFEMTPGQEVDIAIEPATLPIKPTGTSVTAQAHVDYDGPLGTIRMPAGDLRMAFTADLQRVFVSSQDDAAVRLGSLGRDAAAARSPSRSDREALLEAHHRFDGQRDGAEVHQRVDAVATELIADVLELPVEDDAAGATHGQAERSFCNTMTSAPVCVSWDPEGFRDVGVPGGGVPNEDYFKTNFTAAYAWARLIADGSEVWQGRLSSTGCTPSVWRCTRGPAIEVYSGPFAQPDESTPTVFTYGTRDIDVLAYGSQSSPGIKVKFTVTPSAGQAVVPTTSNVRRASSVMSRLLTMPDNGLLRRAIGYTPPPLKVDTVKGCIAYPGGLGEACGDANLVSLGPTLRWVGPNPTDYILGTGHTTQDVYIVGHELGHSAQRSNNGGPRSALNYADKGTGNCGCGHVTTGNQVHCLQSSHGHISAESEGFGHLYATRLLNNQGFSTCRFTYYKTYNVNGSGTLPPPIPINCNVPYSNGLTTGWERSWCNASERSTEYDWLTFLWSVNGSAPLSERTSITQLFSILGHSSFRDTYDDVDFTWPNIRLRAQDVLTVSEFNRFETGGGFHGMSP